MGDAHGLECLDSYLTEPFLILVWQTAPLTSWSSDQEPLQWEIPGIPEGGLLHCLQNQMKGALWR